MEADDLDHRLDAAWTEARAQGVISEPAVRLRTHAEGYVLPQWRVTPPEWLVDVGSGAGVPGLVLAHLLPDTRVTLVDANLQRCELARSAASALELADRVAVVHARVEELAGTGGWRESVPAVVARLFGPPGELAECALPLVAVGGWLVVSTNARGRSWWEQVPLAGLGVGPARAWTGSNGSFVAVPREVAGPSRYPRRRAARRRRPWPGG